ncbi:MAG: hypothetical protein ACK56F_02970, partial [bacterium]
FAEPDLILIAAIEQLDQFQILFLRPGRVDPRLVECRTENAKAHTVHILFLPLSCGAPRMACRLTPRSPDAGAEASVFASATAPFMAPLAIIECCGGAHGRHIPE